MTKFEGAEFLTIQIGGSAPKPNLVCPIQSLDVTRGRIDGRILFVLSCHLTLLACDAKYGTKYACITKYLPTHLGVVSNLLLL